MAASTLGADTSAAALLTQPNGEKSSLSYQLFTDFVKACEVRGVSGTAGRNATRSLNEIDPTRQHRTDREGNYTHELKDDHACSDKHQSDKEISGAPLFRITVRRRSRIVNAGEGARY
jgi:hypothetical protein